MNSVRTRSFVEEDWPFVREFLRAGWREDHPILNKDLFFWQYRGYGPLSDYSAFQLAFFGNDLVGLRGVIPGLYHVPCHDQCRILSGGSFAMWLVDERFRGKGVGKELLRAVESHCTVTVAVGSNENSTPIYRRHDYRWLDDLPRYVGCLDPKPYATLLRTSVDSQTLEPLSFDGVQKIAPHDEVPLVAVSRLSEVTNRKLRVFGLHKPVEFWRWRYLDSPGFSYRFFGDPETEGIVIGRVEYVRDSAGSILAPERLVFRIIELLPADLGVWSGKSTRAFVSMVRSVLAWARGEGCCAVDYRLSNDLLSAALREIGLSREEEVGPFSLCSLFSPLRPERRRMNAHWKVQRDDAEELSAERTYIVKSDNDMDRPNFMSTGEAGIWFY